MNAALNETVVSTTDSDRSPRSHGAPAPRDSSDIAALCAILTADRAALAVITVMRELDPGLAPRIHAFGAAAKAWMAGTSPAMTIPSHLSTLASFLAFAAALRRDFFAFLARLREPDDDGLLAAFDLLAASAALERSTLALAHATLDVLGSAA
jgi:hypothetical protein